MKKCSDCKTEKPLEDFCINRKMKDGRNNRCRRCSAEYDRRYNEVNREKRLAYKRDYNRRNKTRIAEYNAARRDLQRQYYRENAERIKQYQRDNRGIFRERLKTNLENDLTRRLTYLLKARKCDAKRRGREFSITVHDLAAVYVKQGGLCALTGMPFDFSFGDEFRTAPFGPSVDRISSDRGYTPENIQLVCCIVNMAKSDYYTEIFDRMCRARVEMLDAG